MRRCLVPALFATLSLAATDATLQTFTLPNGLRVVLLEDHATPLLRASLRVTWEPSDEPPGKEGLGIFLGTLLERAGAGNQSRALFERSVAASGVRLRFKPSATRLDWTAAARSADQEAALQALAHLVMRPSLDGPSVESVRLNAARALEAIPPEERFRRSFLASLQRLPILKDAALDRIGLKDLETFHRGIIRPGRAVLGLAGDINLSQAKTLALLHLGTWGPAPMPSPALGPPPPTLLHLPEGPPEAWLGVPIPTPTPRTRAALELLERMIERLPDTPLRRDSAGNPYLLARKTVARLEEFPENIRSLSAYLEGLLAASLTPQNLDEARTRWRQEEALLPLNPGRLLDRDLERHLGQLAPPSELQAVTLDDLRALLAASLASRHLLLMGVPTATLAVWLRESPALAPWSLSKSD